MGMNAKEFQSFCIGLYSELCSKGYVAGIHLSENSCDFICGDRALSIQRDSCETGLHTEFYRRLTGESL